MKDVAVSVIVPNYNHARYLPRRVETILGQTFQDFEVILLDDASTDDSRSVIEGYRKHPKIQIHFNERNSGSTFAQWNRGIDLARGRHVWIAESDDAAEPELLENLVPLLDRNADVHVAYCACRMVDEEDRDLGVIPDPGRGESYSRFARAFQRSGRDELADELISVCNEIPNASCALLRKETLRSVGPADASYGLVGDRQFYARILLKGDVSFLPTPWNNFRCHSHSTRERHIRSGRRWRELAIFYEWALRLDIWSVAERRTFRRCLAEYLVTNMRSSRARVGSGVISRVAAKLLLEHPWLRVPLTRALSRQCVERLRRPRRVTASP